jgi:hypothetical protein
MTDLYMIKNKTYYVTEDGYIFSYLVKGAKGHYRPIAGQLSMHKDRDGYLRLKINQENHLVHRFVWQFFNGPIPNGFEINHIDANKCNNAIINLELVSHIQNIAHAKKLGLCTGSRHSPIRCINLNKEFPSIRSASRELGLSHANLVIHLQGGAKAVKGYKFERIS